MSTFTPSATQKHIIANVHSKPTVNPKDEIRARVEFLKRFVLSSPANGFVLGISGGIDSALAGKLAQQAVNELKQEHPERSWEFVAVRLPYGTQKDEQDAQIALDFIQPDVTLTVDIKPTVDAFEVTFNQSHPTALRDFHKGNVKARVRALTQYAIGGERNLLVIGTDQAVEATSGFFTKFGDGAADVLPLTGLTKRQEHQLMRELGAPESIILKTPTADLLDGTPQQADETELGVTYDLLCDYLEGKEVPAEIAQKIEARYFATEHKRQQPVSPFDTWWQR